MLNTRKRKLSRIIGSIAALVLLGGSAQSATSVPGHKFLIASDIHFNPFADPTLVIDLAAAPATQWETILNGSKVTAYSQYSQDTNWWLLKSSLNAMHQTLPNPALVMITGDLLAHDFPETYKNTTHDNDREHYRAFVLKTVQFLSLEFRERLNDSKILITPGNNDTDCGNYDIQAGGPFLADTADLARNLAHARNPFINDWKALGSYTVHYSIITGIRIISLNTVFFSQKYHAASFTNGCSEVDSTAAARTLAWLKSNLAQAREAHQKVWLMLHIPPGIDGYSTMMRYRSMTQGTGGTSETICKKAIVPLWDPIWTSKFDGLLEKYQSTIMASFSGHTHADDFRLIHSTGTRRAFVLIDPPVSPVYGQNPAFRVVTFRANGGVADQSTYFLTNLKIASSKVPGKWMLEYKFSSQWHVRKLDAPTLKIIFDQIRQDPKLRADWFRLYGVSSSAAQVPTAGEPSFYCATGYLDPRSYQACYCPATQGQGALPLAQ